MEHVQTVLESIKDKQLSISSQVLFYEEFKRTMKNMNKVLDWDDSQFGKEVFLSLSGKAAEHINYSQRTIKELSWKSSVL